jgi:hypothetical protein
MTLPIALMSLQNADSGAMFDAVSSVVLAAESAKAGRGGNIPPIAHRFGPGNNANPGGRPKLKRGQLQALADLHDAEGDTPEAAVETFKATRKAAGGLTMADHKAIALTKAAADVAHRAQVSAFAEATDRLEGKVPQAMNVKSEATLTINVLDRDVQLAMLRAARRPELLEAEVVEEGEK